MAEYVGAEGHDQRLRLNRAMTLDETSFPSDAFEDPTPSVWRSEAQEPFIFLYYLRLLGKWLWLIVLSGLVAGVLSSVVSLQLLDPVYEASTTLMVKTAGQTSETGANGTLNDYDTFLANEYMTATFKELAQQRVVAEAAAAQVGVRAEVLQASIQIDIIPKTPIMVLSSRSKSADVAMRSANGMATALMHLSRELDWMPGREVSVIDEAVIPASPASPNVKLNVIVALIAGGLLAGIVVFLLEYIWLYAK